MTDPYTLHAHKCFRCGADISEDDVSSGKAYERDGYFVCPSCVEAIRRGEAHADTDVLKSQLAAMTAELRNISQHLHYEEFSWLFVLGGVLQVVVLFCLYRSYQAVEPVPTLLVAILVQLMAITSFVVGKLK